MKIYTLIVLDLLNSNLSGAKASEDDVSFTFDSITHPIPLRSVITIILQSALTTCYNRQSYNAEEERQSQFLSRLFIIHAVVHTYQASKSTSIRHNEGGETPLYQAIKLHGKGKTKKVINNVNAFGVFVSHCRVKWFVQDGVVLLYAVVYLWHFVMFMWTTLITRTEVTSHRMRFMS